MTCPRLHDVDTQGATLDPELAAHVADCVVCRGEHARLGAIVAMAKNLSYVPPKHDVVEEMRTRVLASLPARSSRGPVRRRTWMVVGLAAAALAIVLGQRGLRSADSQRWHASVQPIGNAAFARSGDALNEIVRLAEGTLHLDVTPLGSGERFRVVAGDGEVEVRGTAFEVEVHGDQLVSVAVEHGRVEIRSHGVVRVLENGQRWQRPREIVVTSPVAVPQPEPRREPPHRVTIAPTILPAPVVERADPTREAERAFRTGWDALGAGDTGAAATAFERAITLDAKGGLADDAAYWRAVALSRARRTELARVAFEWFLAEFPRSIHAGDAALAFGHILLDAGELDAAVTQFQHAQADPRARVRASAEAGLAEIARKRHIEP